MNRAIVSLSLFLASSLAFSYDHTYSKWDAFLKAHVVMNGSISTVQYKKIKATPAVLEALVQETEAVGRAEYDKFDANQKMAFLINAYNLYTVKLIVDNYPVKSIKDLGSIFKSPWAKKVFKLWGEEISLDMIEHENLRKFYNEPRVHFAVVCASKGCPQLRNEAWLPTTLEAQFTASAKNFLSDTTRNRYDAATKKLFLSSIFKWYGKDFVKTFGSVEKFVMPIIASRETAATESVDVNFLDYDWSLNEAL